MNANFSSLNDYELIYLWREGDENAIQKLIWKYSFLIGSVIKKNYFASEYYNDFFQEGILILLNCLRKYDDMYGISFTTFFYKSLRNGMLTKIKKEFQYLSHDQFESDDEISDDAYIREEGYSFYDVNTESFSDFEKLIFNELIIKDVKPSVLSNKLDMDINSIYNCKQRILKKIKAQFKKIL